MTALNDVLKCKVHISCLHQGKVGKLKTLNPEEQPQIHQFVVNSGQSQTAPTITLPNVVNSATPPGITPNESKGKKRRRSTGEKIGSPKKAKPC